jgi:hypothetical protein
MRSAGSIEAIRWPVTMSLLGVCSLFCLLLFIGAIVHSRGTLILFSVCGLFSIILLWLLASIYVTLAVALAGTYGPSLRAGVRGWNPYCRLQVTTKKIKKLRLAFLFLWRC